MDLIQEGGFNGIVVTFLEGVITKSTKFKRKDGVLSKGTRAKSEKIVNRGTRYTGPVNAKASFNGHMMRLYNFVLRGILRNCIQGLTRASPEKAFCGAGISVLVCPVYGGKIFQAFQLGRCRIASAHFVA